MTFVFIQKKNYKSYYFHIYIYIYVHIIYKKLILLYNIKTDNSLQIDFKC